MQERPRPAHDENEDESSYAPREGRAWLAEQIWLIDREEGLGQD